MEKIAETNNIRDPRKIRYGKRAGLTVMQNQKTTAGNWPSLTQGLTRSLRIQKIISERVLATYVMNLFITEKKALIKNPPLFVHLRHIMEMIPE